MALLLLMLETDEFKNISENKAELFSFLLSQVSSIDPN